MDDQSGSGVRITNREIYDLATSTRDEVRDIKAQLTMILGENVDIRRRTRALELKFYAILSGMGGALGLLALLFIKGGMA